jgi:hypothetical protein
MEEKTINLKIEIPKDFFEEHSIYKNVLPFIAIWLYVKKHPSYKLLFGLASYALTQENLTVKQAKIADEWIMYAINNKIWEDKND